MSTDTEQVTISQAAYDHLRVQISMLKDDLHHALEENNKLKAAAKAHVPDEAFNIIEGIRAELTYPGWRQASSRDKVMDWLSDLLSMLLTAPAAIQPAKAQGWKLVPIEPTPDMTLQGALAGVEHGNGEFSQIGAEAVYKAMLTASPAKAQVQEITDDDILAIASNDDQY